ncbi:MAG: TIGR02453 family protein, partial [Thermodesulfobacteriota bacterium]
DLNRRIFDDHVMLPASLFVKEAGKRLRTISPDIVADPRRDKSIFRINKDTRFSKDKTPYKTHLGIYFWEGEEKKLECPGFYFQCDSKNIMFGVGMYMFSNINLKKYRDAVVDKKLGGELNQIIKKITINEDYQLGWAKYKKVPSGYDKDHPNANLLLYSGIGFIIEKKIPKEFYSEHFLDYSFKIFNDLSPIHFWLMKVL